MSHRPDAAALAWILVFGALVNAAAMVDPVMRWMHSLGAALGWRSMLPVTTGFYLAGIIAAPALLAWICGALAVRLGPAGGSWRPLARSFGFALIPLGFSMWVAHFSYHLVTGWRSIVPVLERILRTSTPAVNLSALAPLWLPAVQILLLDGGLILSLYVAWRTARRHCGEMGRALGLVTPWAALAIAIYAASIWILFQPMQMRGMVM